MEYLRFDHVNLRTYRLQEMVEWYQDILSLHQGPRPDFSFPGAWMYAGEVALVHMIGIDGPPGIGSEAELKLEHFAFTATGIEKFEAALREKEITYRRADLEAIGVTQINLWDPDGNHIHIDFSVES